MKAPTSWDLAFYHGISRMVDRRFAFDDTEHAEFASLYEALREVLPGEGAHELPMSNHFYLMVEVPAGPVVHLSKKHFASYVLLSG